MNSPNSMEPDTTMDTTTDPVRLKLRSILRKNRPSRIDMTALLKVRKHIDKKFESMESANQMPILYFNEPIPQETVLYPLHSRGTKRTSEGRSAKSCSKVKSNDYWGEGDQKSPPVKNPIIEFPSSNRIIQIVQRQLSNSNYNSDDSSFYNLPSGLMSPDSTSRASKTTFVPPSSPSSYHTAYKSLPSKVASSNYSQGSLTSPSESNHRRLNRTGAYNTPCGNHQINFDFVQYPYF